MTIERIISEKEKLLVPKTFYPNQLNIEQVDRQMAVIIQNFGPIHEATVNIKPFTVIIGKNNQGKSYCVEIIFTLQQLRKIFENPSFSFDRHTKEDTIFLQLGFRDSRDPRHLTYRPLHQGPSPFSFCRSDLLLSSSKLADKIINQAFPAISRLLEDYLPLLLEERFGVKLGALINSNSEFAQITVDFSEFMKLSIKILRSNQIKVEAFANKDTMDRLNEIMSPLMIRLKKMLLDNFNPQIPENARPAPFIFLDSVHVLINKLTDTPSHRIGPRGESQTETIYIPAGRAGLLEGYYSVASAYFSLATVALPRGVSMPAMPPTASIFYNLLMEFTGSDEGFRSVANDLAKNVMNGEIALEPDNRQPALKKIYYKAYSKGKTPVNIDIIHAGSMVKELAGLYLAIREKLTPKTQLIVEEPEAHLHPSAQRKLARVLMLLASKNVGVTITTHSDIILREIAHLTGKYKKNKEQDILEHTKISVVLLKEGDMGSTSEEIVIPKTGIIEGLPTFDEVINELYEEEVSLQSGA